MTGCGNDADEILGVNKASRWVVGPPGCSSSGLHHTEIEIGSVVTGWARSARPALLLRFFVPSAHLRQPAEPASIP